VQDRGTVFPIPDGRELVFVLDNKRRARPGYEQDMVSFFISQCASSEIISKVTGVMTYEVREPTQLPKRMERRVQP
jgi:hypothetical protein